MDCQHPVIKTFGCIQVEECRQSSECRLDLIDGIKLGLGPLPDVRDPLWLVIG